MNHNISNDKSENRDRIVDFSLDIQEDSFLGIVYDEVWRQTQAQIPPSRKKPKGVEIVIRSILANLCPSINTDRRLCVPINKRHLRGRGSRYSREYINYDNVRKTLQAMKKAGFIHLNITKGEHLRSICPKSGRERTKRQATTIEPTERLRQLFDRYRYQHQGLTDSATGEDGVSGRISLNGVAPICLAEGAEVIYLRDKIANESVPVEYQDTPETIAMRKEVEAINAHLRRYPCTHVGPLVTANVNYHPYLIRIFNNNDWRQGGRLYGYWPQSIKAEDRHKLRIQGEPLADMDFGSCAVALLHFHDGIEFDPDIDPFLIPGFEAHRDTIKRASYAILNSPKKLTGYPDEFSKEGRSKLTWKELNELIKKHIPIIHKYSYTGIGLILSYYESCILVRVMNMLISANVGFIPMHDGIMIPESQKDLTSWLMRGCYYYYTKQQIKVKHKTFASQIGEQI